MALERARGSRSDMDRGAGGPLGRVSSWRRWHRWLGVAIFVPLLFVAITGVLLNHAEELSLNERRTSGRWILGHYGMGLAGEPATFLVGARRISSWDGGIFLEGEPLGATGDVVGAMATADGFAVVCRDAVHLFSDEGALLETLGESSIPAGGILWAADPSTVATTDGRTWRFSAGYLDYEEVTDSGTSDRITPLATPGTLRERMRQNYRGDGLPWSRVLLDLHSGRFFGPAGRWIADACVVFLVLLAVTGLRLSLRGARRARNDERPAA